MPRADQIRGGVRELGEVKEIIIVFAKCCYT